MDSMQTTQPVPLTFQPLPVSSPSLPLSGDRARELLGWRLLPQNWQRDR